MKKTLPLSLAILLVLVVSLTGQASGHALLVRADPTPNSSLVKSPSQVTIWFSEQLNPQSSTIKVTDSSGSQVDQKNTVASSDHLSMTVGLANLSKGVYTVSWVSVSAVDGHLASGSFPFGVGEVVPPPPSSQPGLQPSLASLLPEALARWAFYLGQTILVGGVFFHLLVVSPLTSRRQKPTLSRGTQTKTPTIVQNPPISQESIRRVFSTALIGGVVAIAGLVGLIVDQSNNAQAVSATAFLVGTQLGLLSLTRLVSVATSLTCIFFALRTNRPSGLVTLSTISGLVLILATSLSGHNAAVGGVLTAVSVLGDWVHLVGVSIWIGGLVMIASIVPILRKEDQLTQGLLRLVPRFSRIAVISVGLIAISGFYGTLYQIGSFSALFETEYGQALVVKMILTGGLVILGGTNQLLWYPRLTKVVKTVGQAHPSIGATSRRLSRSVRAQVLVGLVLILVVGFLTALPTAVQVNLTQNRPSLQATTFTQQSNGVNVILAIYPFHTGANSFSVITRDQGGGLASSVVQVKLDFTFKDGALPQEHANSTKPDNNGAFVIQGQYLSQPGNWAIQTSVIRSGLQDTIVYYNISLPEYPGIGTAKVWEIPYTDTSINGYDTVVDGSNNIWFTAPFPGILGRFQPGGDSYQIYSPPYTDASPSLMAMDSAGRIWYADQLVSAIVSFDPATSQFTKYPFPYANSTVSGIAVDLNDSIWVTEQLGAHTRVLGFNQTGIKSGAPFRDVPTPSNSSDIGPIVVDSQGRVWFARDLPTSGPSTGHGGGLAVLDMLDVTSNNITEFRPSLNASLITGLAVSPGVNGDIWFTEHGTNRLSYISPSQNFTITQISLEPILGGAFPWGLEFDQRGNIWMSEHIGNKIAFYDVGRDTFQEWTIPTENSDSKIPAIDQFGNVWFAEGQGSLGVLALQPSAIGLGGQAPDLAYELTAGILIAAVALVTVRWQKLVRFFSRRERKAVAAATPRPAKQSASNKKGTE